jgi:hypothetical protein
MVEDGTQIEDAPPEAPDGCGVLHCSEEGHAILVEIAALRSTVVMVETVLRTQNVALVEIARAIGEVRTAWQRWAPVLDAWGNTPAGKVARGLSKLRGTNGTDRATEGETGGN